ncbi:YihY/virulence factor BrkB family protein [Allosphingosinicella indica]|uniref:Membrane protein n=1 Tax=Allosphingosinicella indica TaxID=941907 RepID=A0A1X7GDR9_9SPHN|nr:YihY/virulence factor BrkB family protein [Allosphingosinicella indica]SMF68182.1 membrane protein [Allosphingosinicella indica]
MTGISPESPEARRKRFAKTRARLDKQVEKIKPGTYPFEVGKRVVVGVYSDGFIHAGNLAYLALLTLFPFVIVAAAVARLFGATEGGLDTIVALLQTMPPTVADVLQKPINDVLTARSGTLLWVGALVGLWTTGSFIETIRDIIRRAYGISYSRPFWEYRLGSMGIIIGSVVLALTALALSVMLAGVQQFVVSYLPGASTVFLNLFRLLPAVVLFGSLYLLFYTLTPKRYRKWTVWPGPALVSIWWVGTTALLPRVISTLGSYDLTYGSLAGVMIALIFFFIIGLGVVIGAELNAALAESPSDAHDNIGQADNRAREERE